MLIECWMFKRSNVPIYQCSNVPILQCSNVPMFQCSNVHMFKYSNVQMFKCSNAQILKFYNFLFSKYSDFLMFKFSNGHVISNPLQGGGKYNRWNMDLWKSTGKVSMSKMLWWKFYTFAITCSTLSLFLLIPPILRFVMVIPPKSQHPFTFLSAKDILWHN